MAFTEARLYSSTDSIEKLTICQAHTCQTDHPARLVSLSTKDLNETTNCKPHTFFAQLPHNVLQIRMKLHSQKTYILTSMLTPAGRSRFVRSSTVFGDGLIISMSLL